MSINDPIQVFNHIAGEVPLRLKGSGAEMKKTEVNGSPVLMLNKPIRVAGCQFEGRQEAIKNQVTIGTVVLLRREPDNEHDKNAIAVDAATQIGYIPAKLASVMAGDMDEGFKPFGLVVDFRDAGHDTFPVIQIFEYI